MCAIVGSFSLERLKKLIELNSYRGSHSHSLSRYTSDTKELHVISKNFGAPDISKLDELDDYFIVHVQAPTTEARSKDAIHPAVYNDSRLWHNGILKKDTISYLQDKHRSMEKWDTKLLLLDVLRHDVDTLSNIDGTFSCLLEKKGELFLFRNEISPMFIDLKTMDISSTRFENSTETEPNVMFKFDPFAGDLHAEGRFTTMQNPYFFGD